LKNLLRLDRIFEVKYLSVMNKYKGGVFTIADKISL
jgi:hypothetical protein